MHHGELQGFPERGDWKELTGFEDFLGDSGEVLRKLDLVLDWMVSA